MKSLSREAIQRMTGGASGASGIGSAGGGTVDLTGYATEIWTEEHYINKEFFSSLFKAYDANGNEVLPNDTETVVSSIKAMFGFWTEFYLSALGTGGQGSVGIRLSQLADVDVTGVANGQALIYNSTLGKWVPGSPTHGTVTSVGMSVPTGLKVTPASITSSGTFSIAFDTGYSIPLTTDVNKGITAYGWGNHAVQGYATQTWVGLNYLKLIGGTLTGTLNGVNWYGTSEVNNNWALWQKATNTNSHSAFCAAHSGGYGMWAGVSTDDDAHYIANFCNGTTAATSGGNSCLMIRADGRVIIGRGFLDITNNSRTVTIGAQNNGGIHIYNDNNSPTFVNGSFSSNANGSYDLGTTNYYWNVVYANRIIAKSGDTILCQSSGNCGIGTSSPNYKLEVNGTLGVSDDVTIANDKHIYFKDSGGTDLAVLQFSNNNNIDLGYGTAPQGYNTYINGNIVSLRYGTSRTSGLYLNASGNVGIGTILPSHKLHVDGVIYSSTGVYSAGYVTALSDIRKKDVVKNFILKAEDIAAASLIKFTWKDKHDTDLHAGGIAQEWQKLLPEAVHKTADDELSMDYSVIALSSAVSLAREVVSLKKTISDLEARLRRFEQMFAINENDIED